MIKLRCKMQDNGFRKDKDLTIKKCRKLFNCDRHNILCAKCSLLEVIK